MQVQKGCYQLKVCEIFSSIQGESSYAGLPCTFVRLTGCNLRCTYCDTQYAYSEGSELSEEDIISRVRNAGFNIVEITGGEPLLQKEVYPLIGRLIEEGYTVLVETNGSQNIRNIDMRAVVILDIKTPGSGMHEEMDLSNLDNIKNKDEVKFVITGSADYEWSKDLIHKFRLEKRSGILLSPAYGILAPKDLAKWMLQDRIKARLNLQIHKYMFDPDKRGV
jgi:7-carboxy-7-deazaguanine synthase